MSNTGLAKSILIALFYAHTFQLSVHLSAGPTLKAWGALLSRKAVGAARSRQASRSSRTRPALLPILPWRAIKAGRSRKKRQSVVSSVSALAWRPLRNDEKVSIQRQLLR